MSEWVIQNVRAVRPGQRIEDAYLRVVDGRIAELGHGAAPRAVGTTRLDGQGRLLTPGLVDVHCHGIHDFFYELGPDHLLAAAGVLARYGTTAVVPTLVP